MRLSAVTILFLVLFNNTAKTQDLIITAKGDSLNCKITKIKSDYIHFTFKYENEIRNTLLPVEQIKFYQKDFYSNPEVPIDKIKNVDCNYHKLRLGGYGGWSNMTAKVSENVPADFKQYVKELKSGYHFGGDFSYFTSENIGFGIKYSMFRTGNELNNIYAVDTVTGQVRTGKLKDDITIQYFGPILCTKISSANKKTHFISDFSLGYLSYKNNATVIENFTLTSGTLGLFLDLGVDFAIDNNLSLGLFFSYTLGTLNQYNYNDGKQSKTIKLDANNLESISRIDLSVGLRWNK
ncbi:MAG: hypothetical protein COZ21_11605 [Bacteroidetes bacterium CG_4_10_14_3_um_filter_31_20]|nr:MAG: hypothetical protein COZ21_11605 [Bacteroidetes bacterium CG_4_10_14_3_um_filter_31_20]